MKKLLFILFCFIALISCEFKYQVKPQQVATAAIGNSDDKWEYIGHGLYARDYYSWGCRYVVVTDKNGTCVSISGHRPERPG